MMMVLGFTAGRIYSLGVFEFCSTVADDFEAKLSNLFSETIRMNLIILALNKRFSAAVQSAVHSSII